MTYTPTKTQKFYKSYQEYINDDENFSPDGNFRLLSTGEVIEVPYEDQLNKLIAAAMLGALLRAKGIPFLTFIRVGNEEIQVQPVGDKWVNRIPDLMVLQPEQAKAGRKSAILFGMNPPAWVAEVVSPGGDNSDNYKRDYIWKRQQYEWWQIPEYWIIDPHREKVTVLTLVNKTYQEQVFTGESEIASSVFPTLKLTVLALLQGEV